MSEPVIIGDCTLYLGDCLEILPALSKVDADGHAGMSFVAMSAEQRARRWWV